MSRIVQASQRLYQQRINGQIDTPHIITPAPVIVESAASKIAQDLPKLKPVLEVFAKGYREAQVAKIDDELLKVEQDFSKWSAEYKEANQGKLAENAAEDFAKKHAELAEEAEARFDGSVFSSFTGLLKQRLQERQVQAGKEGLGFQVQQDRVWKDSQLKAQIASFSRFVENNAADYQACQMEADNLIESYRAKNPGQDITAFILDTKEKMGKARFETLFAQKNYSQASQLLAMGEESGLTKLDILKGRERIQGAIEAANRKAQAQTQVRYDRSYQNFILASYDGKEAPLPFTEQECMKRYGAKGPEVWENIQNASLFATRVSQLNNMSTAEIIRAREEFDPKITDLNYSNTQRTNREFLRVSELHLKAREKDPLAYMMRNNDDLAMAAAKFTKNPTAENYNNYQELLAVDGERLGIKLDTTLTKGMATMFAQRIEKSQNPVAEAKLLQTALGPDYEPLSQHIFKKSTNQVLIYGSGDIKESDGKYIADALKDPKFYDTASTTHGIDVKATKEGVARAMAPLFESLNAGGSTGLSRTLLDSAAKLAVQYQIREGLSAKDAIKKAANNISDSNYDFNESPSGVTYRMTKKSGYDPSTIERGLNKSIEDINPRELNLQFDDAKDQDLQSDMWKSNLKRNITAITSENGKGVYLSIGGALLTDKKRTPVYLSFDELNSKGEKQKAEELALNMEVVSAGGYPSALAQPEAPLVPQGTASNPPQDTPATPPNSEGTAKPPLQAPEENKPTPAKPSSEAVKEPLQEYKKPRVKIRPVQRDYNYEDPTSNKTETAIEWQGQGGDFTQKNYEE